MKTISVMVAGQTSNCIKSKVGSKRIWYKDVLSSFPFEIQFYDIFNNESISMENDDAWIITGSEFSVYDNLDWLNNFKIKLLEAINMKKPILGICFGHQLLADVLGGAVKKNNLGWEVGYAPIQLSPFGQNSKLFNNFPNLFFAAETHQDIVEKLNKKCKLLAFNDMGIQAFSYEKHIYGVQFHPEFNENILDSYIDLRSSNNISINYPNKVEIDISTNVFQNFIEKI